MKDIIKDLIKDTLKKNFKDVSFDYELIEVNLCKNKKFDKDFLLKLSTGLAYLVGNPNFDSMTGKYYA